MRIPPSPRTAAALVPAILFSASLLSPSSAAPPAPADPTALAAYRAARAGVGRDAEANVRLALWCEAHGLTAERLEHLAMAVAADPANAAARGLMGLVVEGGRWRRPDDVAERVRRDAEQTAVLREYAERRARTPNTADGQWKLALWCEARGLKPEAYAHLTATVRLDPNQEAAWKHLGCKKVDGRWLSEEEIAARKGELDAQQKADRHWKPRLEKLRADLKKPAKAADAESALADVVDPRAVPSVLKVFGPGQPARATQILGQIDSPPATRALAGLATFADSEDVRRAAIETLRQRDPREYANLLIAMLGTPLKYEVRPVGGPGSPGAIFVAGERFNLQRLYRPPAEPDLPLLPGDAIGYDADGLLAVNRVNRHYVQDFYDPGVITRMSAADFLFNTGHSGHYGPEMDRVAQAFRQDLRDHFDQRIKQLSGLGPNNYAAYHANPKKYAENAVVVLSQSHSQTQTMAEQAVIPIGRIRAEYAKSAMVAQQQLAADVAEIEGINARTRRRNERITQVLKGATGEDLGEDREQWKSWYVSRLGYSYTSAPRQPRPTLVQDVPLAYLPDLPAIQSEIVQTGTLSSTVETSARLDSKIVSCFGAGTLVKTLTGDRPIESLEVGDRVLAQDPASGTLSYEPILAVHHNPPSATLRVDLGRESVVASTFHRFWVAGKGWKMARDLKVGDPVRTLDGTAKVIAVEDDKIQPVFNLDVAGARTFFVGEGGALVHDNSVPDFRAAPFDAAPELVAAKPRKETPR